MILCKQGRYLLQRITFFLNTVETRKTAISSIQYKLRFLRLQKMLFTYSSVPF